jgi:hypothetical protein
MSIDKPRKIDVKIIELNVETKDNILKIVFTTKNFSYIIYYGIRLNKAKRNMYGRNYNA